jgi:crotonobetainyl-CoA:carnitine CoA-transferase CaiB-like acyl-CoA transferase
VLNKPVLHNVRILDFTWVLAGPYATRLLADYGAEVIKIQPLLPPEEDNAFTRGYYQTWNRNKLGVTLNLADPEGIDIAKKLVAVCDAVIENFTPHVMANFGLDYGALKKIKPDIIMVSMSTMGQRGEQSHYTGYAPTVHALAGLTSKMTVDGQPVGPGFSFSDHIGGLYASMSLLAALEHRRQTGEGRHIDLSQTELLKGLLEETGRTELLEDILRCGDQKWCAITVTGEKDREALQNLLDCTLDSPDNLKKALRLWAKRHTAAEAALHLQQSGIAAAVVADIAMLADNPQSKARDFFRHTKGTPLIDTPPLKMTGHSFNYKPAPAPGQDNADVYGKLLGLKKAQLAALHKKGVI